MGDYTKLIVNCSVEKMNDDQAKAFEELVTSKIRLVTSAYHCGGEVILVKNNWHHRTDLTIVTQAKYSNGIEEFLQWLKPQVTQGFGEGDIYAIVACEYSEPKIHKLNLED